MHGCIGDLGGDGAGKLAPEPLYVWEAGIAVAENAGAVGDRLERVRKAVRLPAFDCLPDIASQRSCLDDLAASTSVDPNYANNAAAATVSVTR